MKKRILLFCLIALFVDTQAQKATTKHYAIDGSEWVTKYDRDKKERLIWEKIDIDLKSALVSGRLGEEKQAQVYHDQLKKLFGMCRESVETLRNADAGNEIMQNAEFRFFLSENGVKAKTGEARNKKVFNFEEYARCFDEALREYSFNANIVSQLADPNGKEYNLDFVVNDFADRMDIVQDHIERERLAIDFKATTINKLVPRYEAAKKSAEQLEKRRQK